MPLRLGPGPVFAYEWLTAARRWQPYAVRSGFVWLILMGLAIVESDRPRHARTPLVSLHDLAVIGEQIYRAIAVVELTLVLLVAPAATAGAICLDKARGTLDHMLATDLSNAEIVLGKLGVRLIPVLGLIACTLPVLALTTLLGGVDPLALVGLTMVAVGCAFVGCTLAMVLSIYGRKAHEVVMMAYILIILWIIAPILLEILIGAMTGPVPPPPPPGTAPAPTPPPAGPPEWMLLLHELSYHANPFVLALAPYGKPPPPGRARYLGFLAVCLAVSAALVLVATARVRRVALRQMGRPAAGRRRRPSRLRRRMWPFGPSLDRNPVAWREWHRTRPALMMRIAWGLYAALGLLGVFLAARALRSHAPMDEQLVGFMNAIQVTIGLLLLSVGAATGLAEERVRGSLDVLLSTPMSTRSILAGKWWGSSRRAFGVALWPAATTALLAYDSGYWIGCLLLLGLVLAHGAVITSLGLAIATWVSRPGRAIAICVTLYFLFVIGWPIAVNFVLWGVNSPIGGALLLGDPPIGVIFATMATSASGLGRLVGGTTRGEALLQTFGWIMALAVVAAALFKVALATFDRCLGRIPDDGSWPPPRRTGRSSLSQAELLAIVRSSADGEEP